MAGMLPGVEAARRRRFHQSGGCVDSASLSGHASTRRSSFCLYTSNLECHLSSSSSMRNVWTSQGYDDEKLGDLAREAKRRLDERLKAQWKSENKRSSNGQERSRNMEGTPANQGNVHIDIYGLKKSGSKRFNWAKLRWKSSEQEECSVCLEQFKTGETLMHLPCAHKFHSKCLVPWIETSAHCPCCRMEIPN